jgi:hypothetical protein
MDEERLVAHCREVGDGPVDNASECLEVFVEAEECAVDNEDEQWATAPEDVKDELIDLREKLRRDGAASNAAQQVRADGLLPIRTK